MNVLILCAGKGTRLSPWTDRIPKPLLPLAGKSMLERVLEDVEPMAKRISVNAHHLADQVVDFVKQDQRIEHCFVEETLLGTGSPLYNAYLRDREEGLLILNGDVYTNLDLKAFVQQSQEARADVALLLRDNPEVNTVFFTEEEGVLGIKGRFGKEDASQCGTFTGVSYYSPKALQEIGSDRFDIRTFWKERLESGKKIHAFLESNPQSFWIDIGTPKGLAETLEKMSVRESLVKDHRGNLGVEVPENCELEECYLLETPEEPLSGKNLMIGKDFTWKL